jgi:hypothetical protein
MANALDTFREQRAAAGEVYAALRQTSELLRALQSQVNALAQVDELKALLQHEDQWLRESGRVVAELRRLRDDEMRRLRPAVARRWALALVFALGSAVAAGAGYSWASRPYQNELESLRSRIDFAEAVEHRALTMTPAERRQFDALMRWSTSARR